MKLNELTLTEVIAGLKEKKFSRVELVSAVLARINAVDQKLHAYLTLNENVLQEAKLADESGQEVLGIPVAVKDVLATQGLRTTASSKLLEKYVPVYDATVVGRLRKAGALIVGKTNCDAFAFGASTENSGYGPVRNPWALEKTPGGSSGGSAAAVAADECIFALGTDTGGSIRQPASFTNTTGLKPTYGACSRYGLLAMASSFDCPGPMAKTVEDCQIIFDLIKGKDPFDATSSDVVKPVLPQEKVTIGLPKEYFAEGIAREIREQVLEAAKFLEEIGYNVQEISLPNTGYAISIYYVLVPSEISSNMARYDGIRFGRERSSLEEEVKRRIMVGTYTLSAGYFDHYYLQASKVRTLIQQDFEMAFKEVDLLLGPVYPVLPFKLGEKTADPVAMYLADILTVSANLAGIPGLALPCGFTADGLPVGLQLLGPHFSEKLLFKVGKDYQALTDWHKRKPVV